MAVHIPDPLRRLAGALFQVGGIALFCWVLAHWTWRLLEPPPASRTVTSGTDWSTTILSGSALGFSPAEPGGAATASATGVSPLAARIRLLGISRRAPTTADGGGQALFRVDQKRVVWLEAGKSIEPGVVLAAIEPNGVRLLQNGQEVRLPLREPRAAAAPGNSLPPAAKAVAAIASVPVKAPAAASPASCRLTQEQRTRAYVLRPEIIDTVMRERAGWTELFKPTAEGVMVQNPGGTGAMLGLYGNDLLVHANGARLGGAEDVLRLVMQPLARNESVIVTGSRSGQPREWIYSGMNCAQR